MMIKPLLVVAMALGLSLFAGCSQHKHGDKSCCGDGTSCCVDAEKKSCPADCDKPCCADKGEAAAGEAKACPAGCTKACCTGEDKAADAKACPAGCTKACCADKAKAE